MRTKLMLSLLFSMSSDHPKVKNFSSPRLYKGNSKSILVGCSCKHPSLNSHENGVLVGCFFKNSKYVYKHLSTYVKVAFCRKVRGLIQIFILFLQSSLSFNSRGSKLNLRQGMKKVNPPTYVKVGF